MSDISPPDGNRGLQQIRDRYERQKKELKDQYEEQLSTMRSDYEKKVETEEKSGEAAVNHIQQRVIENTQRAENIADKSEHFVAERFQQKQDHLKQREAYQNAYLDQAKKRHSEWTEGQMKDLDLQNEKIKVKTSDTLKSVNEWSNNRIEDSERKTAARGKVLRDQGQERLQEIESEYDKRSRDLESRESKRYDMSREQHTQQLNHENQVFKDASLKEKDIHAKTIAKLQEERTNAHKTLREKTYQQLNTERMQSEKRLNNEEEQNALQLSNERERFIKTESKVTGEHQHVLKNLQDKTNHEEKLQKSRLSQKLSIEKQEFEKQTNNLRERHFTQLDNQMKAEMKEMEINQEAHHGQLSGQNTEFNKKFTNNEAQARQTYANQAINLSRELTNQKQKFLKASDKYANKESDPFYQIRDNKTKFTETDGAYVLKAHVPEHEKDSLKVRVKGDRITLSGNRSFNDQIVDGRHVITTNNIQTFNEHYEIPKRVKEAEIIKTYDNGVLTVVIPKVS